MGEINWKDKCWVSTIYLVKDNKVLLTWNKNMQTWIPVGGHIDPGETPDQAVIREVEEEVGCKFEFVPVHRREGPTLIISPLRVQVDDVPHHGHHINLLYVGRVTEWQEIFETDEQEKLRWFSKDEILKEDMLPSVKSAALEALELVK